MGHGATAASIMHLITYYSGQSFYRPAMKQAILHSPASVAYPENSEMDEMYKKFLEYAGAKDLDEMLADNFSTEAIISANDKLITECKVLVTQCRFDESVADT
jgi:hypothetical protein